VIVRHDHPQCHQHHEANYHVENSPVAAVCGIDVVKQLTAFIYLAFTHALQLSVHLHGLLSLPVYICLGHVGERLGVVALVDCTLELIVLSLNFHFIGT